MSLTQLVACCALLFSTTAAAQESTPPKESKPETVKPSLYDAQDWLIEGDYERAAATFDELASDPQGTLDPQDAMEALLGLVECYTQTGRYEEALTRLEQSGAKESARWHYAMALVLEITGRYDETIEHAEAASKIDKNHAGARLLLGRTHERLGRRDKAIAAYAWFDRQLVARVDLPRDAEWITHTALGFLRYSTLTRTSVARRTKHVLNELLQMAYGRLDRTYWPARIAAADLLREKYNNDEEDGSLSDYNAALRINENLPQAYVGIGTALLAAWSFEDVEEQVELALKINPSYAPAIRLQARKLLVERRYAQAIQTCARALKINPNDMDAMAISAAASACQRDDAETNRWIAQIEKINPRSAALYFTLGDALGGIRQYAASEKAYKKAIEFEPTDANSRTELGMMYMQWGHEDRAREALEAAWDLDPFNQRTDFTLELLDSLDNFARIETEHFVVKFDANHDPGLAEYLADYLESIYSSVTGDYDTVLKEKTVIELFPTLRAFGVRITGKPWIHTVGACTGSVIALSSPRDMPSSSGYDITRVLKHEFTHTVTLSATHNRIPHWFTEGLAVYQEDAPPGFNWCQLLADAVRRDRLFTLESINWGFMRPKRPNDRQLAYAQSEWMCEYIVERFGYDSIGKMLRGFRDGRTQAQVLANVLNTTEKDFDNDFRPWARDRIAQWGFDLKAPENVDGLRVLVAVDDENAVLLGRLARAELDAGDPDKALNIARQALVINAGNEIALTVLGKILLARATVERNHTRLAKLDEEAVPAMTRLAELNPKSWTAPKYLAGAAVRANQIDIAETHYKKLKYVCPIDPASYQGLSGIYLQRDDEDAALPLLLELARITQDSPDVPAAIAGIYKRRGRMDDALIWFRAALAIKPFSIPLHKALGDASMQAGHTKDALRAYTMLTKLQPTQATAFEQAAFAAHKLGDAKLAATLAGQAVKLDPTSGAKSLLP